MLRVEVGDEKHEEEAGILEEFRLSRQHQRRELREVFRKRL